MTKTPYEIPDEMRAFAERSVEQARKAMDTYISAAHKTAEMMQGSTSIAQNSGSTASRKAIAYAEQNIAAAFDHAQKLVRAKDFSEVMALQAEYLRNQMGAMQAQMQDVGSAVQKAAVDAGETVKKATAEAQKAAAEAGAMVQKAATEATRRK